MHHSFKTAHARIGGSLGVLGIVWAFTGCAIGTGSDAENGGGPNESVGTTTEADLYTCSSSSQCKTAAKYDVNGSWAGPSAATHLCYMTSVFPGPGKVNPDFRLGNFNGQWSATGYGQVMCTPQCCFHGSHPGEDVRWMSGTYSASTTAPAGSNQLYTATTAMWQSDAMQFLTGVTHLSSAPMGNTSKEFSAATLQFPNTASGLLQAWAFSPPGGFTSSQSSSGFSFFVGRPYIGKTVNKKIFTAHGGGPAVVMMLNVDGVCALNGAGMITQDLGTGVITKPVIEQLGSYWRMYMDSSNPNAFARANCYYFNQPD